MARSKTQKSSGRVRRTSKTVLKRSSSPGSGVGSARARLLAAFGFVLVAAVLLGLLERFIWFGAIAREFSPLLSALCVVLAACAALARRWLWLGAFVVAFLLALAPSWSLLRPVRLTPLMGPVVQVAEATLDGTEVDLARVRRLRERAPDLLAVIGASAKAARTLDIALPDLPFRARVLGAEGKAALWSRWPLRMQGRESVARIRIGKCDVQLTVMAAPSLVSLGQRAQRAQALRFLEGVPDSARAIWLGALGSRPKASDLSALMTKQRLRDTRLGHGLLASGPSWLGPLGLSTDHVLVRGWIAVRERSAHEALAAGAHATQWASLELTDPRCRVR